jgi:hypothetical protein
MVGGDCCIQNESIVFSEQVQRGSSDARIPSNRVSFASTIRICSVMHWFAFTMQSKTSSLDTLCGLSFLQCLLLALLLDFVLAMELVS